MDLLEIRKKAKENEGGDKGKPQSHPVEGAPLDSPAEKRPDVPAEAQVKKARRKRQSGDKAKMAAVKPVEHEASQPTNMDETAEAVIEDVPDASPGKTTPPAHPEKTAQPPAASEDAAAPEADDPVIEYLAFMLASEEYAVKVEDVKEIIRGQNITGVPRTPGFVIGIISLRGVILPVFDIKKRLGLEGGGSRKTTRIVVVSDKSGAQGIMVDKVTGVVKLKKSAVEPSPAVIGGVEAEYIEGLGRIGDRLLILFNTDKVLTVG